MQDPETFTSSGADAANMLCLLFPILIFPALRKLFFPSVSNQVPDADWQRFTFFDQMKGLAILGVILIHVTLLYPEPRRPELVGVLNLCNNLSRFCIPFFLLSSAILLRPFEFSWQEFRVFMSRKMTRIFVPYLACTLFLWLYYREPLEDLPAHILRGDAAIPYYFAIVLVQLYLLYPLLIRVRDTHLFLPLSFLVSLLSFLTNTGRSCYGIPLCTPFLYFFTFGIRIRNQALNQVPLVPPLAPLTVVLLFLGGNLLFPGRYGNTQLFYGISLFLTLLSLRPRIIKAPLLPKLLEISGRHSLWIFLLHMGILHGLLSATDGTRMPHLVLIPFIFFTTTGLSLGVAITVNYLSKIRPR